MNNDVASALEGRPSGDRLHVEFTPELEGWMHRTFKGSWKRVDARVRRMRYIVLFQTDLVDQILVHPDCQTLLGVIGNLGETHAERSELVSRGLGPCLARVAAENNLKMQHDRKYVPVAWLFLLQYHIDYLRDSEITCDMVKSLATALSLCGQYVRVATARGEHDRYAIFYRCFKATLQTLSSIALRGPSVSHLFDAHVDVLVGLCTRYVEDNLRLVTKEHVMFQACVTLAAFAAMVENPTLVEHAMIYFRWVKVLRFDTEEILSHSISNLAQRVEMDLSGNSHLRPGEYLHAYLSLCSFTASSHVRFIGAIALCVVLDVLAKAPSAHDGNAEVHSAFDQPPSDTPASRTYTRQALDARLRNDATLIGCHVDRLRADYQSSSGPHAFLAEAVLRLVGDTAPEVRKIGQAALERLPLNVLQQAVWCPSLHQSFCQEAKQVVLSTLILSGRGELPLPVDLLVTFVFPFACTAVL
jgi:hypothetical protein